MPPSNERSVAAGSREKGISIERKAPSLLNQVWTEVAAPENLGLLWPAGIAVVCLAS